MKLTNNHSLEEILAVCYAIPMGNPLMPDCIWGAVPSLQGPPGIGKSGRVKSSGRSSGLHVGIVELGGRAPEDASGAPFLNKQDEVIIACLLGAVNELNAKGRGVLFLDEINWARPNTQGAFLSAVQDRRVGDTLFSNEIRVVLASNPQRSAGGGHPLIPPMANRCLHFEIDKDSLSAEDEDNYLIGAVRPEIPVENVQRIVMDKWQDHWPVLVQQMIDFKKKFPDHVLEEPQPGDPNHHKAWPSPRSRELALRAITTIRILKTKTDDVGRKVISPLEDIFMEAACGTKVATDWAAHRRESDLPDPADVLKNGFTPDMTRLDRTFAVYKGCLGHIFNRNNPEEKKECAGQLWDQLIPLIDAGMGDQALWLAKVLAKAGLHTKMGGTPGKAAQKVFVEVANRKLDRFIDAINQVEG